MQKLEKIVIREIQRSSGHPATKLATQKIVLLFFKCLFDNGVYLKAPHDVSSFHIKMAVDVWLSDGVKNTTIKNRISGIRRFCKIAGIKRPLPTAGELGLLVPHTKKFQFVPASSHEAIAEQFFHPASRSLALRQIHFGLTKNEALHLNLAQSRLEKNSILIPRSISCNGKDRVVPVCSAMQEEIILKSRDVCFLDKYTLNQLYLAEIKLCGFHHHDLRLHYVYFRLPYLDNCCEIQQETGISQEKINLIKAIFSESFKHKNQTL